MKIEPNTMDEVLKRLRRVEGQLGGIVRMIEDGRDCEDVVTQLASASKALDRAGFKIVASGMRQCMDGKREGTFSETDISRMERLFLSLA
jgi:DNA-binding FrmR family transcriptional regulator